LLEHEVKKRSSYGFKIIKTLAQSKAYIGIHY